MWLQYNTKLGHPHHRQAIAYKDKKAIIKNKWKWKSVIPSKVMEDTLKTFRDVKVDFMVQQRMSPEEFFNGKIKQEVVEDPNDDSISLNSNEEKLKSLFDEQINIEDN